MPPLTERTATNADRKIEPRVSVIVLLYNDLPHGLCAVRSVLSQTFRDIEVVVMDNGSTDGTWDELQQFTRDKRVRLIRNPRNQRSEFAALEALRVRSEYFSILFADDAYTPERLEKAVRHLDESGEDYVFFNNILVDEGGALIERAPVTLFGGDISRMDRFEHIRHFLARGNSLHPCAMVVRAQTYRDLGGFAPYLHRIGDYVFFFRLLVHARGSFLPDAMQRITVWTGGRNESARNVDNLGRAPDALIYERSMLLDEITSPGFLAIAQRIFGNDGSRDHESWTEPEQLWFVGHALLRSYDFDFRLFAFRLLYRAASLDHDRLSRKVLAATGQSLAEYIFTLSATQPIGFRPLEMRGNAEVPCEVLLDKNRRLSNAVARAVRRRAGQIRTMFYDKSGFLLGKEG